MSCTAKNLWSEMDTVVMTPVCTPHRELQNAMYCMLYSVTYIAWRERGRGRKGGRERERKREREREAHSVFHSPVCVYIQPLLLVA